MKTLWLALALPLLATLAQAAGDLRATYNGLFVHLSVNGTFPTYRVERATGEGEFELLLVSLTGCTGICNYDDFALAPGAQYRYRIRVPKPDGSIDTYGPTPLALSPKEALSLHSRAVPNPAPARTHVRFTIPAAIAQSGEAPVVVMLYDAAGRELDRLWERSVPVGEYEVLWDGRDRDGRALGSGAYFYRVQAGAHSEVGRITLLR